MKRIIRAAVVTSILILMTPAIAAAAPASNQQGLVNQQIEPAQVKDAQPQNKINNQPAQSANAASLSSSSQASDQHSSNQGNGQGSQTYTQQFQNTNTTLSGKSVRSTTYFNKIDYWDVKKATFNLTYATTQLRNDQASNITVSLNGVKFYSFKPSNNDGQQTISIDLPLNLLQSSNVLTIQGQIIDQNQSGDPESTPANWLTIYNGSNVNFSYDVKQPDNQISAFYNHFTGNDTVSNHQSVILVPAKASNDELAAATYALTGISRVLTTNDAKVNISSLADSSMNNQPYQIVIAKYNQLPQEYHKAVNASDLQNGKAILKFVNGKDKKVLVVTAKSASSLIQAGKYISNEELMKQTTADSKMIDTDTEVFSSQMQNNGDYPLATDGTKLTGSGHQEQVFFINLPHHQNNSKGSYINLNFKYADNIDFKTSLVTVYVNGKPIGSKRLTAAKVNGDHLKVNIPNNTNLSSACTVRVAFDLNMKNDHVNGQTPWAYIENDSNAYINSTDKTDLLFNNYPSCFIKDSTFNNIAVQLPHKMNQDYYQALSNIFNLIGCYAETNVGNITFHSGEMADSELANHNVIVLGTPKDTSLIRKWNSKLFFKFNKHFNRFVSNEKMSIESDYGKQIGVVQLLFNPENKDKAALVVSGATPKDVELASTQIDTQAHAGALKGDAAVIDQNGRQFMYRFKKKVNNQHGPSIYKRIKSNPAFMTYMIIGSLTLILIAVIVYLFIRKNFRREEQANHE